MTTASIDETCAMTQLVCLLWRLWQRTDGTHNMVFVGTSMRDDIITRVNICHASANINSNQINIKDDGHESGQLQEFPISGHDSPDIYCTTVFFPKLMIRMCQYQPHGFGNQRRIYSLMAGNEIV